MVSLTGSWMQGLAQGWLVWRLTQSTFLLGLVGFAQLAPVLLLGLVGGVAADRFERRRIVLATQVVALAQSVALAALTLSGRITVGQVLALATVMGVVNAFDFPGRQSLISELVEREDLGNAIALNSTIFNGARIVGPSLAGAIVAAWGEGTCFAINAVSYLAVIASLLAMRFPARPAAAARDGAWRGLLEGVAYARRTPHVRALLGLVALTSVFGMSYLSFLPAFAGGVLERGPGGLGLLMGSVGAGAVVGALSLAWRRGIRGLDGVVFRHAVIFGSAVLVFSLSRSFPLSCAAVACAGYGAMVQMAACNTLLQALVPDALRGRLMSLYTVGFAGLMPLGSLAIGLATRWTPLPATLAACSLVVLGAGAAFGLWARGWEIPAPEMKPGGAEAPPVT
ncbi:MAG: MFS transporter [Acidobacteria bacterium]|nr:MFS transporter [Acidobacteriota bacterium]